MREYGLEIRIWAEPGARNPLKIIRLSREDAKTLFLGRKLADLETDTFYISLHSIAGRAGLKEMNSGQFQFFHLKRPELKAPEDGETIRMSMGNIPKLLTVFYDVATIEAASRAGAKVESLKLQIGLDPNKLDAADYKIEKPNRNDKNGVVFSEIPFVNGSRTSKTWYWRLVVTVSVLSSENKSPMIMELHSLPRQFSVK